MTALPLPTASRPATWRWLLSPGGVVALFMLVYLGFVLVRAGGDPLVYATLGAGFRAGQPIDPQNLGYDGQFSYYLALDPRPAQVAPHLDLPAYRYQRLLYPLLAWGLAGGGQPALVPWGLVFINIVAQLLGTLLVETWLTRAGVSRWYALIYGLWVGLLLAVRCNLGEPVCYAFIAASFVAHQRQQWGWAALWLSLALLTKETALLFWGAYLLAAGLQRHWRAGAMLGAALLPFAGLQLFLYLNFGQVGLASGGYLATPFELVPFMGLLKLAADGLAYLVVFTVVFGPLLVFPSVWGIVAAARQLWQRDFSPVVWALAITAGQIPFTPYSTFSNPIGMLRLATGLVLATLLFSAHRQQRRVFFYATAWLGALVLLFTIK